MGHMCKGVQYQTLTIHGNPDSVIALALGRTISELVLDGESIMVCRVRKVRGTPSIESVTLPEFLNYINEQGYFGFVRNHAHLHIWLKHTYPEERVKSIINVVIEEDELYEQLIGSGG